VERLAIAEKGNRATNGWFLYFLVNSTRKLVKIGRSRNPTRRVADLQSSSPHKLKLAKVFPAPAHAEGYFHKKFKHLRVRGEWFKVGKEILEALSDGQLEARADWDYPGDLGPKIVSKYSPFRRQLLAEIDLFLEEFQLSDFPQKMNRRSLRILRGEFSIPMVSVERIQQFMLKYRESGWADSQRPPRARHVRPVKPARQLPLTRSARRAAQYRCEWPPTGIDLGDLGTPGMMRADLLAEIAAFQRKTGQSARAISVNATGDSGIISRLRSGRHITTFTGEKLQRYMRGISESDNPIVRPKRTTPAV
jgi:hypothetical protein